MTRDRIEIEAVTTRDGFEALAPAWDDLLARGGRETPFLTPDWFRCCLEADASRPLHVLVARSGSRAPLGIAPLWEREVSIRGMRARALTFIASSETPATDLIVDEGARAPVLRALLDHLYGAGGARWDVVALPQWPEDAPNLAAVLELLRASGRRSILGTSSVAPYVPIAGDWESYWQSRTYLFRKSRRGIMNRLNRAGDAEIVSLGSDRPDEAIGFYFHVASRGWKEADGLSATIRPELVRFFRCLTEAASRRGWLRVWGLRLAGVPVAAEYDLVCAGRAYALRADFDQEYARHSPGAYLEYHLLRQLFEEGCVEYNAGPGRDAYKTRWADHERVNRSLTLCRSTPRGLAIWLLEGVVAPRARRLRDRAASVREREGAR